MKIYSNLIVSSSPDDAKDRRRHEERSLCERSFGGGRIVSTKDRRCSLFDILYDIVRHSFEKKRI